jgi:hypothetical protein
MLLALVPTMARAIDVTDLLSRMRAATEPGRDMRATFELVLTNQNGERSEWGGQFYRTSGATARQRIVLESPVDLRGVCLTAERAAPGRDSMRVYLPSIRRVRQIEQDMRGESFLGSDFNYEDLGFEQLEYAKHAIQGDGEVDGRPCYLVESDPDRSWWYGRIVRCIDKADYLPRRTEYFDPAGQRFKLRTFDRVEKIKGHPTPVQITMTALLSRTSSRIVLRDVEYDTGLDPGVFQGQ